MAQLKVHHNENSRSQRVLWLLEELDVPYELVCYKRDPETIRAPPELAKIHPLGKSPVVTIGEDGEDGEDVVLVESGAIIETLAEDYGEGRLVPERGTGAHRRYRFWIHYAEGSLMAPLLVRLIFSRLSSAPMPFFIKPVVKGIVKKVDATFTGPEIAKHIKFLEGELAEHTWFSGDEFSAADVQMSYALEGLVTRSGPTAHPRITAFLERIHGRPAYVRAIERGGAYDLK
jgi:glutathione S-transferase